MLCSCCVVVFLIGKRRSADSANSALRPRILALSYRWIRSNSERDRRWFFLNNMASSSSDGVG